MKSYLFKGTRLLLILLLLVVVSSCSLKSMKKTVEDADAFIEKRISTAYEDVVATYDESHDQYTVEITISEARVYQFSASSKAPEATAAMILSGVIEGGAIDNRMEEIDEGLREIFGNNPTLLVIRWYLDSEMLYVYQDGVMTYSWN